jgi:pre-rRNA-processing protein TSR3
MEDSKPTKPRIIIFHAEQCDPRKCTGIRLSRMKKAVLIKNLRAIPRGSIVLNPLSEIALSPADANSIHRSGITALDCSWKQAESIFRQSRYGNQRALPYLLAANPINTYKPIKLSTAEAIAAALYITGLRELATDIMSVFKWGSSFITLNKEWLDAYAECRNSTEVVEVQQEIMETQGYYPDSDELE